MSVETKTTAAAAMSEISGIHESKRMLGRYETRMAESVIVKAISPADREPGARAPTQPQPLRPKHLKNSAPKPGA